MRRAILLLATLCACQRDLPTYGNVEVWVDTDAPVPSLVTRLRVDVYDGKTWVSSRSFSLHDPADWPASFVVAHPADDDHSFTVRLRAYADGTERDYLGERYVPPPDASDPDNAIAPDPPRTDQPRLAVEGTDQTPPTEPSPALTIDRLLRVDTHLGNSDVAHVVLRGECFSVMADMAKSETCVDHTRLSESIGAPDPGPPAPSVVGTYPVLAPVTAMPAEGEVSVPGGAYVLGSRAVGDLNEAEPALSASPERIAVVAPLFVDRTEVTVARFRQALSQGFVPSVMPDANEGPLGMFGEPLAQSCTFSAEPRERESYPINCIPHASARELCRFFGGDMLTEAQWEWIATAAAKSGKTPYPWGTRAPGCDVIVYRGPDLGSAACILDTPGYGPAAVTAGPFDDTSLGVHGLFGNVREWVVDAPIAYGSAAWRREAIYDRPSATRFVVRGQSWEDADATATASARAAEDATTRSPAIGVRCARPAR